MTTADPLSTSLLPARPWNATPSEESPQGSDARPFGLSLLTPVPDSQIARITGVKYDSESQISVTPDGQPLATSPLVATTISTTQTVMDMQEWTDQDPDD